MGDGEEAAIQKKHEMIRKISEWVSELHPWAGSFGANVWLPV